MAHDLRPFRSYDEHDVVNLFAYSGDSTLVKKGLAVAVVGNGWTNDANSSPVEMLGSVGASYANVTSQRYGAKARVGLAASGDSILGLTLMDIRETDENGEKLLFNPRKAAEMNVVISGQVVPVLTKGLVTYSGAANVAAGSVAYVSGSNGELAGAAQLPTNATKVGKWLSANDANGVALLKIEL